MNYIFYVIGKSSSGKDTIYQSILKRLNLLPLVLYTTRPMRQNEQDGREYHFIDRDGFEKMLKDGNVIEQRTYDTIYGLWTYFTGNDSIDLKQGSYLGIGTLESYLKLREFWGADRMVPLYIQVDDDIRLMRAIKREQCEAYPNYKELCRRFIADSEDFSDEKLKNAGIETVFDNNGCVESCIKSVEDYMNLFLLPTGNE